MKARLTPPPSIDIAGFPDTELIDLVGNAFAVMADPDTFEHYAHARSVVRAVVREGRAYIAYEILKGLREGVSVAAYQVALQEFVSLTGTGEMDTPKGHVVTRSFSLAIELQFAEGLRRVAATTSLPLPREFARLYSESFGLDRCAAFAMAPSIYRPWEFLKLSARDAYQFTDIARKRIAVALMGKKRFVAPELLHTLPCKLPENVKGGTLCAIVAGAVGIIEKERDNMKFREEIERRALVPGCVAKFGKAMGKWGEEFGVTLLAPMQKALPGLSSVRVVGRGACGIIAQIQAIKDDRDEQTSSTPHLPPPPPDPSLN